MDSMTSLKENMRFHEMRYFGGIQKYQSGNISQAQLIELATAYLSTMHLLIKAECGLNHADIEFKLHTPRLN